MFGLGMPKKEIGSFEKPPSLQLRGQFCWPFNELSSRSDIRVKESVHRESWIEDFT